MKQLVNFRLSAEARRILAAAAKRLGVTRTAVIELLLRQYSQDRKGPKQ